LFAKFLDGLYDNVGFWLRGEQFIEVFFHFIDNLDRTRQVFCPAFIRVWQIELSIFAHEFEKHLEVAFESDLVFDLRHLGVDARNFFQTDLVNLVRAQVRRRGVAQGRTVELGAIRKFPHTGIVICALRLAFQKRN